MYTLLVRTGNAASDSPVAEEVYAHLVDDHGKYILTFLWNKLLSLNLTSLGIFLGN